MPGTFGKVGDRVFAWFYTEHWPRVCLAEIRCRCTNLRHMSVPICRFLPRLFEVAHRQSPLPGMDGVVCSSSPGRFQLLCVQVWLEGAKAIRARRGRQSAKLTHPSGKVCWHSHACYLLASALAGRSALGNRVFHEPAPKEDFAAPECS